MRNVVPFRTADEFEEWLEDWLRARFGPGNTVNRETYRDFATHLLNGMVDWLLDNVDEGRPGWNGESAAYILDVALKVEGPDDV